MDVREGAVRHRIDELQGQSEADDLGAGDVLHSLRTRMVAKRKDERQSGNHTGTVPEGIDGSDLGLGRQSVVEKAHGEHKDVDNLGRKQGIQTE